MRKLLLLSVFSSCLILNGCSKDIESEEVKNVENTETVNLIEQDEVSSDYEFPYIPNDNFYDDVILANNEELYRKLRFNDFEVGSKVIGGGLVHILQTQDDGRQATIISTKPLQNMHGGLYDLLTKKADFSGNYVLLVFNPAEKARVLTDDTIAFKGVLAPSDVYTYTNDSGEIEEIPIIYVHFYESGNLSFPLLNEFLEKPKDKKINENNQNTSDSRDVHSTQNTNCESDKFNIYETRFKTYSQDKGLVESSPEYKQAIKLAKISIQESCAKEREAEIAGKPSFNCQKAKGYVEETICSTVKLGALDTKAAHAYSSAKFFSTDKDQFYKAASDWRKRRAKCTTEECIEQAYLDRIQYLNTEY